ncbi:MAG TPA: hypothetical protein PLV66_00685 [Thermoanaerobaculales bacterium]|nr:hypothetical protein [Thermoanaerobaculales bacterium]
MTLARRLLAVSGVLLAVASAPARAASPTCNGTSEHLMSWPAAAPVWELCWVRPAESSGPSGSGLEIRDAHYRGTLVFKRAHVPILNVDYDDGGCGCFRDWLDSEQAYRTDNPIEPGLYQPPFPPETVCDHATNPLAPPGDCPWGGPGPCLEGVSVEHFPDHIRLTSEGQAGWYRYSLRWEFYQDGTVLPTFGFGTSSTACSGATHRHHAYWRLDFDISGPDGDTVSQLGGSLPGPIAQEAERTWEDGSVTWEVRDAASGRGYLVTPGIQDRLLPADDFSRNDVMVSQYHSTELSDGGGGCAVNPTTIVNGEPVAGSDVVLYYRGGVRDVAGVDIHACKVAGPVLTPVGDWNEFSGFADGFESGDTAAWSATVP